MELELKAERGCPWGEPQTHLWHMVQVGYDTALCELRLDHEAGTWPLEQWTQDSPERLCSVCRRRYAELLPFGGVPGTGALVALPVQ